MGMRQYAIPITATAMGAAAKVFGESPSATNWARVAKTMKAHQFASFEPEQRLEFLLRSTIRSDVVDVLSKAFDGDLTHLESEVFSGMAKLIPA